MKKSPGIVIPLLVFTCLHFPGCTGKVDLKEGIVKPSSCQLNLQLMLPFTKYGYYSNKEVVRVFDNEADFINDRNPVITDSSIFNGVGSTYYKSCLIYWRPNKYSFIIDGSVSHTYWIRSRRTNLDYSGAPEGPPEYRARYYLPVKVPPTKEFTLVAGPSTWICDKPENCCP